MPLHRRALLAAGVVWSTVAGLAAPGRAGAARRDMVLLDAPQPLVRLHAGEGGALLGVSAAGGLWRFDGVTWRELGGGLDAAAPLASGHGRIVGRSRDGGLWVLAGGRGAAAGGPNLAPHGGMLVLALGVIAVAPAADGTHRVVRLEPGSGGAWVETARSAQAVLPDAQPLQFDPGGRRHDDDGHVVVLAGPDRERYRHAVLGDDVEATAVLLLERHGLAPLARLELPSPFVFEDIAPRVIGWRGARALLTVRSGPQGGQLVVVAAAAPGQLTLAALGTPIGTRHRWLSPSTDGTRLLAVHTPHIGGVLLRYRDDGGERLAGQVLASGVSNHVLGERDLNVSAWVGRWLVLPNQDRRSLRIVDADAVAGAPAAAPAPVEVALSAPVRALQRWDRGGETGIAVLLQDGRTGWVSIKG